MQARSKRAAENRGRKAGKPRRRLAVYTAIPIGDDEEGRPRDFWPTIIALDGEPPPAIEGVTYAPRGWIN